MQQHGSKYFACRPPPPALPRPWEMGSKGQNSTFSENLLFQNMVMLYIKLKGMTHTAS